MLIPLKLLQKCFSVSPSFSNIIKACEQIGIEIETISLKNNVDFKNVFTSRIVEVTPHPNADKLKIAVVFDGIDNHTVVCGALNCRPGLITAFAKPGAVLRINQSPLIIKKTQLRGIESAGMLCAFEELFPDSETSSGIMELSEDTPLGEDYSLLIGDPIIEIALTPNLGHCCSLMGLAREIAPLINNTFSVPDFLSIDEKLPEIHEKSLAEQEADACPFYVAAQIDDIPNQESPSQLKELLSYFGIKSVNPIVDITNFIMSVTGQPMHAFDASRVDILSLRVNKIREPQSVTLLNDKKVVLKPGTVVVEDDFHVLAIAGIMGAADSSVTSTTNRVVLESAYFFKKDIRFTENYLQLYTDASYRFSRGTDPELPLQAMKMALSWLSRNFPEIKIKAIETKKSNLTENKTIIFRNRKMNVLLDSALTCNETADIFRRLNFEVIQTSDEQLTVRAPSYRHDINEEVDLIEEISKIIGLPNNNEPDTSKNAKLYPPSLWETKKDLRSYMVAQGFYEFYTCDLLKQDETELINKEDRDENLVTISTSKSSMFLRPSLLPGLLRSTAFNIHRNASTIRCFEIGKVYKKINSNFIEEESFALLITGLKDPESWNRKNLKTDFFELKGIVENIFDKYALTPDFIPSQYEYFHPYQQADIRIGKNRLGKIGSIHPEFLLIPNIKQEVFFFECLIKPFVKAPKNKIMQPISEFPGSTRDVTLSVTNDYPVKKIIAFLNKQLSPLLESIRIKDIYCDDFIVGNEWKNVTLTMTYRSLSGNLSAREIDDEYEKLMSALLNKLSEDKILKQFPTCD
ncbi:MAG: phenylalanine--tRNA ligase subunit beta [Victivallaceae bacterium]